MATQQKSPEVRFDGFTEDWETATLGSLVELENGFAFKSEYFQEEDSEFIVLTPGNINIGGGFQYGKGNNYNPEGEFADKYIIKAGEVFLTMTDLTPTAQTLGFPAIVPNDGKTYLHNQRLGKLININCDITFLFQLLCRSTYQNQVVRSSSGTTVKHTSPERVLKTLISFPEEKEQQHLGLFFDNIDKLIGNHQTQLAKLKNLKKAMLTKMFPQDGASVPEIRFKGFDAEWVIKEIENLANRYDNLRIPIKAEDRVLGKTPYYGANGIQGYIKGYTHDGEFVLVAEDGANDLDNYPVQFVNGKIWVNNHAHVLQAKDNVADNVFLKYAISSTNIKEFLVGGGRAKLNAEVMMGIELKIPKDIDEQIKIGVYFKNLDVLIENHMEQLKKLNNIKKACLSKLFVA